MGKLKNDQLVGLEHSDTDEDENMQEVLELLKKGDLQNIGPEHNLPSSRQTTHGPLVPLLEDRELPSITKPNKTSKFRLTRPQSRANRPSPPASGPQAVVPTPPILPQAVGVAECQPLSGRLVEGQTASPLPATALLPRPQTSPSFPTVLDSPSSRASTVIDSPSFQRRGSARPDRPPIVMSSTVLESTPLGTGCEGTKARESPLSGGKKVSRFLAERM